MASVRALACPASLKSVLSSREAAAALARGLGGCDELPLADGGEGTADVLPGVVEAASAIPFDPDRLDPFTSSRPFGELLARQPSGPLLVGLGGTANMDAGEGLLEVLDALPPTTVLCDVATTLYDAPRVFGPQKGATPEQVAELEARFRANERLRPYADIPGSGAAGGLGAALASLGAELCPGAATVLDLLGFDPARYDLVVTGEGRVDATTREGKVPFEVARRCRAAGVRCVVFGGVVDCDSLLGAEVVALSGDPGRAASDLEELGSRLLDAAG
ncbi:MAG TPA: glycerate kinase [Gaiellaceae bacterium]|nr:glycerate kinase [Gaiellaceae bacterium]